VPVESIIEGTWASDDAPAEWADFILMRRMHWSWDQLQATPLYVRRYALDFLGMIAEHEDQETKRAERKAKQQAR
jgi:hypothetical protein